MSYTISLTNDLVSDLDGLRNYLFSQFSESISNEVIAKIFATFDSLQEFPRKGKDATNLMFVFSGYRYLPLEKNVLFYSINEVEREIKLLRLFSVSEDFIQKFDIFLNE